MRNKSGEVIIIPADKESEIYYTLDGSIPTTKSKKYTAPVSLDGKAEVKAISYDAVSGKSSPVSMEKFDISRKDWKVVGIEDQRVNMLLDGDSKTAWHQPRGIKLPADLVIDLGSVLNLAGFKYLPDQGLWNPGIIVTYQFFVSKDNIDWKLVDEGEFANIKNNPLWQIKKFAPVNARFVKFRALSNTVNDSNIGYAEIDVVTF
jgi:alpha-L-fucosidase